MSFDVQQNVCAQICGDGLVLNESCDLGTGNDLDGCTDTCEVESGFTCSVDSATAVSTCSYDGTVEFTLLSMSK